MELSNGPYYDLKPSFKRCWREDTVAGSRFLGMGKKYINYWEATVDLSLHLSYGEKIFGVSKVKGTRLCGYIR